MEKRTHLIFLLGCLFYFLNTGRAQLTKSNAPEILSLDEGWLFHLGDISFPEPKTHSETYLSSKAGGATGAAAIYYDDQDWREVTLPHDWAVESAFDSTENVSQGYRKRGFGWYRRYFTIDSFDMGKSIELQFDGISTYCDIWVNGIIMHRNFCGYTSSYIDITPIVQYGKKANVIAVKVDSKHYEGWWYEGAGIYRHTWLVKRNPVHVITNGVYANPVYLSDKKWIIPAEITLQNDDVKSKNVEVEMSLQNKNHQIVAKVSNIILVSGNEQKKVNISLYINNPEIWSLRNPVLYNVITTIKQNDKIVDATKTKCGFRTFRFDADSGFYLNGDHIKIKGVCNHQDAAGVGVAVPDALWEFRLRKLKEMGANAYRCSHNPPSKEFLDACDSLGILVMDENRNFNTSPEYVRQLQWMVRRDRNHPCVILWSVFNEEPMQATRSGYEMVRYLREKVRELDTTRPVTAAQSDGQFAPFNVSQGVDVVGFNYQMGSFDKFYKLHPNIPVISSEDVSALMTRGAYTNNNSKHIIDAYDDQKPGWGSTHRDAWKIIAERPFVAGCFIWTGFDYRGEPTPYTWPSAGSFFGAMDQCGFPKMAFWLYQALWRTDTDVLHIVPDWNWPEDSIGKNIKVMALSNADSVLLRLNGKIVASQKVDKYNMNTFEVSYQPGTLDAVAFKNGKVVSQYKTQTTGNAQKLKLIPYRKTIGNDGWDAMPVTVEVQDASGLAVPDSDIPVHFEISNNADIIGLGNGDPNSHEPEKGNSRNLFNGLAQAVIQSKEGATGNIILKVISPGMQSDSIKIPVDKIPLHPFVEVYKRKFSIDNWRMSPVTSTRPDPNQKIADNDMNSWSPATGNSLQNLQSGQYVIFRSRFKPYQMQQKNGGKIIIEKLAGKAEIWLDGKLILTKSSNDADTIIFPLLPSKHEHELNVLFEYSSGSKIGLSGNVFVE